jgi:hypothetical protein
MFNAQWVGVDGLCFLSQLSTIDFRYWRAAYIYVIILSCGLVSYFQHHSSFNGDQFLGPLNITCTFRTVQPDRPPTIRVFQPRDREQRCQTREIPSQICKPTRKPRA